MSYYQNISADWIYGSIILSTVVCAMCFRSGYSHRIRRLLWSSEKGNPPCNAEDNLRAGLIVIEAWFRGY